MDIDVKNAYDYFISGYQMWLDPERGPFSIYEQPKYKPNLTLTLIQTLTLKPTWVDATIRSHFGCSYIEKEPGKKTT